MINNIYVEMLANKIFNKEINPNTKDIFKVDDIKKTEYVNPILDRINELEIEQRESEVIEIT